MKTPRKISIGLFHLLAVVFVVLKLTEVIAWSWWWVLAPLWIPWALPVVVFIIALVLIKG